MGGLRGSLGRPANQPQQIHHRGVVAASESLADDREAEAPAADIVLRKITAVLSVTPEAVKAWEAALWR